MTSKTKFSWFLLVALLAALFILDLLSGSVKISVAEAIRAISSDRGEDIHREILLNFRLTKALTCILAGGSLALAGLQMQTLFRNPLAGPDVLGLSSGASLAVSILYLGTFDIIKGQSASASWSIAVAASVGCMAVFLIMLLIARKLRDNVSLLLVGLMIGAATSSVVSLLQYISNADDLQLYMIWTFGTLGALNWAEIMILGIVTLIGAAVAIYNMKALNAWMMGEYYARSIGINLSRSRVLTIISGGILTGAVTAFCGPIAFVGLAVPHLVKLIISTNDHKKLIPAVLMGGASLLLFCDIIAQLPNDIILPVNAITALIGAPVVIWVVINNKSVKV
ncbi:MAG TPA: iron ABC transporter permease [Chryseosolibacter sp.]|nr:iron ABC transporter permease [Chryseosolibacter sp.]